MRLDRPRRDVVLSDRRVELVALAAIVGAWVSGSVCQQSLTFVGIAWIALVAAWWFRRPWMLTLLVGVLACGIGSRSWSARFDGTSVPYSGPATLVTDPVTIGPITRVVVRIGHRRFEVTAAASPGRRIAARSAMQVVWVDGTMRPPSPNRRRRLATRHIVGALSVDHVIDWAPGNAVARSTERVRVALNDGASIMTPVDRSLYLGLVLGDDRNEPTAMVDDFRRAGLGHLTAVSGQNVAFLMAVALPILRRWRTWWRWLATMVLLAWFCALTRFEPSVLRATVMAGLAATAFATGRSGGPRRVLALAVTLLVLADPLLVWSAAFWLSVSATYGIVRLARPVAAGLPGPRWLAVAIGVTLSAQVAVAPVAWLVFGRESVLALPANLLAEPVAAFVMTYGLPAGLLAAAVPRGLRAIVHAPTAIGVRWLATVAHVAARGDHPAARMPVTVAGVVVVAIAARRGRARAVPGR
jgi:competence protein ComEC